MRDLQNRDVRGKRVLVVGLGVSGIWTTRWLTGQEARVTVSEIRRKSELDPGMCKEMEALGVRLEAGGHRRDTFLSAEMIIPSPGVPLGLEVLAEAIGRGIPVMGELELASQHIKAPMIAVTGTNGKSTVTALIGFVLENAGNRVFVGGNIGTPVMEYMAQKGDADYLVLEVSSFQLDISRTFRPFVSLVLNISPDHLDRYPDYESYVRSKLKIFGNQGPGQYVILNADDKRLSSIAPASGVTVIRFGMEDRPDLQGVVEGSRIRACLPGSAPHYFSLDSFGLPGRHNLENALAGVLTALIIGVDHRVIQRSIDSFTGLPYRLEQVLEVEGVEFYNDSKATNVDAAVRAIESFERPIILIAGGRHKGGDYSPLVRSCQGRVRHAVFLGEARHLLAQSFEGVLSFEMAKDMDEAVSKAFSRATRGDVVLLAPACSSFDMYADYFHRGRAYTAAVERLGGG
jgi:UDP-N-acetylmuramoylalanine--D-glutamate ligase